MYNWVKNLGKQSIIYGIGGMLNQFVSILLVPVYTRYLTPEEYGVVQILTVTAGFVVIVAQLGLASAIFKSALHDKSKDTKTIYSTAFYLLGLSAALLLGIGSGFAHLLSNLLFNTSIYARLVWILFVTAALDTMVVIPMARLRIEGRAMQYSVISFASFSCRLLLNVVFIVLWRRGASGLIEANAVQSLLFVFVYLWLIKDQLVLRFSTEEFLNLVSFGLPIVPALISSRVLVMSDRYILNHYADLAEVGLYSLGYRIASAVSLAVSAFQTAWPAMLFSLGGNQNARSFYARVMTYLLLFSGYLALGLSILSEDLLRIISSESFLQAYKVVPFVSLSYVFYGSYFVANAGIQLERKTHYLAYVAGAAAALQVGMNFLIVPRFGMMGAAFTTAISYLTMPVMVIIVSRRFYRVSYEYRRIAVMAIVGVGLYLLSRLVHIENHLVSFSLRGLIAFSFPLVLGLLGFYTTEEKKRIHYVLRRVYKQILKRFLKDDLIESENIS